ncbi:MAG: hypothetical protein WKG07_16385 [Hymenobacter sp.]
MRLDKTSKFLSDVRQGVFPSVGAAWRISNEDFLKNVTAISLLKLRASYGAVGNRECRAQLRLRLGGDKPAELRL